MIRKLRLKFVAICMALVTAVLAAVFFSVYFSMARNISDLSRGTAATPPRSPAAPTPIWRIRRS